MWEESKPLRNMLCVWKQIQILLIVLLFSFIWFLMSLVIFFYSLTLYFRLIFCIVLSLSFTCSSCMPSLIHYIFACPFSSSNIFFFSNFSFLFTLSLCHSLLWCNFVSVFIDFFFSHSSLNPFQGRINSVCSHSCIQDSSLYFSHLQSFLLISCSFILIFCSFSFVYLDFFH